MQSVRPRDDVAGRDTLADGSLAVATAALKSPIPQERPQQQAAAGMQCL
jgi:hypothetical protein